MTSLPANPHASSGASEFGRTGVSLAVTVLNEGPTIDALCDSIVRQTRPPDEVVVVDGGSRDDTVERLHRWDQRLPLRVLVAPGANIARGRNLAIEACQGSLVAVTDAGVRLDEAWLEQLLAGAADADIVSGFFQAEPRSLFEMALGATVLPSRKDVQPGRFLPSSRSVLLHRSAWKAVGGYPEWLDFGEDLLFDLRLRDAGYRFAFQPSAFVWFRPRSSLLAFTRQYYLYARGDGKANLWPERHVIRYATYAGSALILAARPRAAALLLLAAALTYVRQPLRRLWPLLEGRPLHERLLAIALVPAIRGTGDAAKMAGYPAGWWWRWRIGRQAR